MLKCDLWLDCVISLKVIHFNLTLNIKAKFSCWLFFVCFLMNYKEVLTGIYLLLSCLQFFGEVFHYKLDGYKISKTHLSWTLNAELRGLSFKPQAVGATKGFSMVKVVTRRVTEGSGNSEWDSWGRQREEGNRKVKSGDCQKHSKERAFHSRRIRGHCYFLAGVKSCRLDLEMSTGPRTRAQEHLLLDFTPDPRSPPPFCQLTGTPLHLWWKGWWGWAGVQTEVNQRSFACLEPRQCQEGPTGKRSRGAGFRPASLAACASPRTGFFAFLGLRCPILQTERLLWMIAMVLSSLRIYKISSVLLI